MGERVVEKVEPPPLSKDPDKTPQRATYSRSSKKDGFFSIGEKSFPTTHSSAKVPDRYIHRLNGVKLDAN